MPVNYLYNFGASVFGVADFWFGPANDGFLYEQKSLQ
jgi:hypothetical protein